MMSNFGCVPGRWMSCLVFTFVVCGCVSDQQKIGAIQASSHAFSVEYERILVERGSRVVKVLRAEAFVAMRVVLSGMGMRTENQDLALGTLRVAAPAPAPLTSDEWIRAADHDLPLLKKIIEPHVGMASNFVQFEPQGLDIIINATFLEVSGGVEVSITVRSRETAAARTGWPRREYLPPTAVRTGLDKIWRAFEQELRAAGPKNAQ